MEGVDWIFDVASSSWTAQSEVEQIVTETKKLSNRQLEEQKYTLFKRFLNSL